MFCLVYWSCQFIARASNTSLKHWELMGGVSINEDIVIDKSIHKSINSRSAVLKVKKFQLPTTFTGIIIVILSIEGTTFQYQHFMLCLQYISHMFVSKMLSNWSKEILGGSKHIIVLCIMWCWIKMCHNLYLQKYMADIGKAWPVLIVCGGILPLFLSVIWLMMIRHFVAAMPWITVVFFNVLIISVTMFFYVKG